MKILTISGWGQDFNILSETLNLESNSFSYITSRSDKLFLSDYSDYDLIIGWSLGGQIAQELAKKFQIKKLVLISTPYNFIDNKIGISTEEFQKIEHGLEDHKEKFMSGFRDYVAFGDSNIREVKKKLTSYEYQLEDLKYWLDFLKNYSPTFLEKTPEILLIYGDQDHVVNSKQGELYAKNLPNSKLEIISGAAHAPFLHDPEKFNKLINDFAGL